MSAGQIWFFLGRISNLTMKTKFYRSFFSLTVIQLFLFTTAIRADLWQNVEDGRWSDPTMWASVPVNVDLDSGPSMVLLGTNIQFSVALMNPTPNGTLAIKNSPEIASPDHLTNDTAVSLDRDYTAYLESLSHINFSGRGASLSSMGEAFDLAPNNPRDDTTPGFYRWRGGDGSVTDGDNWDPDDSGPPGGSVPGTMDGVEVDTFDSITLTGNLNVKNAGLYGFLNGNTNLWGHITMTGTVTTQTGLGARDTTFQQAVNVTAGGVSSENVQFNKAVTINGSDPLGPGDSLYISSTNHPNSLTEFVTGSSLSASGLLFIDDAGHSGNDPDLTTRAGNIQFDSGVTAASGPASGDYPAFKVTALTALLMKGNAILTMDGGSYTVHGDARIGLGQDLVDFATTSQVNVSNGGVFTIEDQTALGFTDANFSTKAGAGAITVDGTGSKWVANGDILFGAEAGCTGYSPDPEWRSFTNCQQRYSPSRRRSEQFRKPHIRHKRRSESYS